MQLLLMQVQKVINNRRGEIVMEDDSLKDKNEMSVAGFGRDFRIDSVRIHIHNVFNNKVSTEEALKNIVLRKITAEKDGEA